MPDNSVYYVTLSIINRGLSQEISVKKRGNGKKDGYYRKTDRNAHRCFAIVVSFLDLLYSS